MSKSYRKPYSAITGAHSAHDDKTVAARMVRRAQNNALRTAIANQVDWDEFLLPEVYECSHNDVWGWSRDGKQRLQTRGNQYNNPFAYVSSPTWMSTDEIMQRWKESKERDDWWVVYLKRK